jgi:hypothetical protein
MYNDCTGNVVRCVFGSFLIPNIDSYYTLFDPANCKSIVSPVTYVPLTESSLGRNIQRHTITASSATDTRLVEVETCRRDITGICYFNYFYNSNIEEEIKYRITLGNKAYYANQFFFKSRLVSKN